MKFLLTQLRRIGDVMMTTPSIRALREAFPEAHISYLTEAPSDQVLCHNPYLDEILVFPKNKTVKENYNFIKKLRQQKYDCVIDFFGNPRSAFMTRLTGAPIRIGFDFRGRSWLYTHPVMISQGVSYSAQHKAQLLEIFKIKAKNLDLDFFENQEDREYSKNLFKQFGIQDSDLVIALSPVSRQPYKVWPPESFAKVADHLIEKYNAKILFHFGPNEEYFVDAVKSFMLQTPLPNYEFKTLSKTLSIFKRVDIILGNDNGPRHIAISSGIPTVTVFGRGRAANWTPPSFKNHKVLEYDPGCKSKCHYPACKLDCLTGVTVEKVITEIEDLIESMKKKVAESLNPVLSQENKSK